MQAIHSSTDRGPRALSPVGHGPALTLRAAIAALGMPARLYIRSAGDEIACVVPVTAPELHGAIYGLLDQHGWAPDPDAQSRHGQTADNLRLRHRDTGAKCLLVVQLPRMSAPAWEAA